MRSSPAASSARWYASREASAARRCAVAVRVDRRPVLRADVVALAHALRRVVALPEDAQQLVVTDALRVEDDQHDLGVTGQAEQTSSYVGFGVVPPA